MAKAQQIYAYVGNDEALVKEAALAKATELAPPDDEFGLETIVGGADNSEHAERIVASTIEAIQTLPFFGGKTVWLQGANFFADSQTGRSETTLSAAESLIEVLEAGLPPDVHFVLSATDIDKRRVFYKRLGKLTKIQIFDKADTKKDGWEEKVAAAIGPRAEALGLRCEPGALERLVTMVGSETRLLESELEKLSLYVGDRAASEADVAAIVSGGHLGIIFKIGEALSRRDLPRTLGLIERQLAKGENAVGLLLAAIVPQLRRMLTTRALIERHRLNASRGYPAFLRALEALPTAETAAIPKKKDGTGLNAYPYYLAAEQSRRFSAAELVDALEACQEANLRLVTTPLDPLVVLNQLVAKILAKR